MGYRESVGDKRFHTYNTLGNEAHCNFMLARYAAVGTGNEAFLIVYEIGGNGERRRIFGKTAEEVDVTAMATISMVADGYPEPAGDNIRTFAIGFLKWAFYNVFLF